MKTHLLKISLLLLLVAAVWSCRKEHAVPTANVLASYKGSDKNVLKIIDELKKPENNNLLATLNQQGEVDWQNYQAMITSDFMQGLTLRFYQGPDSNYFDAQFNLETKDLRLLSKAQKRVEREQALEKLKVESKTKGKSTTTYASISCKAIVYFEFVLILNSTTFNLYNPFGPVPVLYSYPYQYQQMCREFLQFVRGEMLRRGFANADPTYYVNYNNTAYFSLVEYYNEALRQLKESFYSALSTLRRSFVANDMYLIDGGLRRFSIEYPICTVLGGGVDPDPNCSGAYGSITGQEVSDYFASRVIAETVDKRTMYYEWKYLSNPFWYYASKEVGVHKKVGSEWQWESLKHDSVYRNGAVFGGTLSMTVNNATPTIGIYNAGMTINYDFYGAADCKGSTIYYSRPNVTADSPVWNCNN